MVAVESGEGEHAVAIGGTVLAVRRCLEEKELRLEPDADTQAPLGKFRRHREQALPGAPFPRRTVFGPHERMHPAAGVLTGGGRIAAGIRHGQEIAGVGEKARTFALVVVDPKAEVGAREHHTVPHHRVETLPGDGLGAGTAAVVVIDHREVLDAVVVEALQKIRHSVQIPREDRRPSPSREERRRTRLRCIRARDPNDR